MKLKELYLTIICLSTTGLLFSQIIGDTLEGNSNAVTLFDQGELFHNKRTTSSGYEFPAGSGNHLIYRAGFWFGGTDQNNDLRLASGLYGINSDFYRGPYSTTTDYFDTAYVYAYEKGIWTISKSDIIYHIDNYDQPNYVASDAILDWPGNGNPGIGVAEQLAPYVDVNNNDIYEPYEGDYPCIKGDMATYQIMHEDRSHNNSGGDKIGAEIHIMVYQNASSNFVDSTTFIDVTVINRGQHSFNDFKSAFYVDGDIGFSGDEYMGSSPAKNMMYIYNATNADPGGGGQPGYGSNPPAMGVVSLNKNIEYAGYFNRPGQGADPATLSPNTAVDFWNYMNGKWLNGSNWTEGGTGYGGSVATQYIYDGNPYIPSGWTELNTDGNGTSNTQGDRRFLMVSESNNFSPGDSLAYHYAVLVNRSGNNLENAQGVIDYADSVQEYYNNNNFSCVQQGTGNTDTFEAKEENLLLNFEITRVDGEGNMSLPVSISSSTEQNILDSIAVENITYERGRGPISARLTDTVNHATGHFVLKFNPYGDVDTANWTVYHYDTIGGTLIDSVNSDNAIDIGNEQIVSQWGIALRIEQMNYFCSNYGAFCTERDKVAAPIYSDLSFSDENSKWLTGVKNANGYTPVNWVMSGIVGGSPNIPGDSIHNPACYQPNNYDSKSLFSNMVEGISAPGRMARYSDCMPSPLAISSSVGNSSILGSIATNDMATVYHPSIDIVFTNDTSKWTRCPVIELHQDDQTALNGGKAGFLRQSPSIDKLGNPDGSGTGMGWFPGYAIDVETGRRLNMAYCENSTMTADNGDDMVWNPSERLMDNNGNYVLGGQHTIYVFGGEEDGMPNYDEGEFIRQKLAAENSTDFRDVYGNLSWVVQPLLVPGEQLNSTEARMKLRLNKEFKTRVISDRNEGRPMFSWDVIPYEDLLEVDDQAYDVKSVKLYPNPTSNQVVVEWENIAPNSINLYSFQGRLVRSFNLVTNTNSHMIDVSQLRSGVYFVKVGNSIQKLIIK